jgi:DNA helicase-2/ATP-dependent DNA helicase PcrA
MFYADLHVHSKFSRATSRDADLEHLAVWAAKKGLAVVATGDFTHPAWFAELRERLEPAEPGLFRLRSDGQRELARQTGGTAAGSTRFLLQVEISTIYKRGDRTRKVHHIIYAPDFSQAERLTQQLSRIGNLASDGRPILGLDSRDLLEIVLHSGEDCYLVPAHIWTPWFAVLGSKSGFDSVDECYADLASHIFALETGLSSDPPMNWRLSQLDRFALVSNSDAHSPPKLGREACVFGTELDYFAMRRALETGVGYGGTVEFFPEEGKHLDGHRKCGVCLEPAQTRRQAGLCPVCGKGLTVGVMSRVEDLADRPDGVRSPRAAAFRSLIPLSEIIAEIRGVGEKSRQVEQTYEDLVRRVGPELSILQGVPAEDLRAAGWPLVAEAVQRMRAGRVIRQAGYDGEYGVIRLFEPRELSRGQHVGLLFDVRPEPAEEPGPLQIDPESLEEQSDSDDPTGSALRRAAESPSVYGPATHEGPSPLPIGNEVGTGADEAPEPPLAASRSARVSDPADTTDPRSLEIRETCGWPGGSVGRPATAPCFHSSLLADLDADQRSAAACVQGPLLIVAGPGTGKTRTLTHRIAHLVADHGVLPEQCLAISFSRRAAAEISQRLEQLLPNDGARVPVLTFHALGLSILREHAAGCLLPENFRIAGDDQRLALLVEQLEVAPRRVGTLLSKISRYRRGGQSLETDSETAQAADGYRQQLRAHDWVDFDDLILLPVELLEADRELADHYRQRWPWISIDEYQDIDDGQYRLVRQLAPPDGNLCAIGDPDQSIYGFRGANPQVFLRFTQDYPGARTVQLTRNYRSSQTIVAAALQAISPSSLVQDRVLESLSENAERIVFQTCPTDRAEAEFVVHTNERLIGGSTFFSLDSGRVATHEGESLAFRDFAVLYRTAAQAAVLAEAFSRSGIPFQRKSHDRLCDRPAVQALIAWLTDARRADRSKTMLGEIMGEEHDSAPHHFAHGACLLGPAPPQLNATAVDLLKQAADAVWDQYPDVAEYLPQLHPLAERCGDDPRRLVQELELGLEADLWDPRAERVSLLTLHAAKGLEFSVVFLVGCEDGVLPLRWGDADADDVDEERRLFFVGMTRARDRLYLSHARQRSWRGQLREMPASPFLREIQDELLERAQRANVPRRRSSSDRQLPLF